MQIPNNHRVINLIGITIVKLLEAKRGGVEWSLCSWELTKPSQQHLVSEINTKPHISGMDCFKFSLMYKHLQCTHWDRKVFGVDAQ